MQNIDPTVGSIPSDFSEDQIARIIEKELPDWKAACENQEAKTVLLTQAAFGHSAKEMLLLAAAIKYAGKAKKPVTVIPQE